MVTNERPGSVKVIYTKVQAQAWQHAEGHRVPLEMSFCHTCDLTSGPALPSASRGPGQGD